MTSEQIPSALADITAETDPTLKHLKLASLVSAIFRERGIELVVVGGSGGTVKGNRHLNHPKLTPIANLHVAMAQKMGLEINQFGDSNGVVAL